IDVVRFPPAIPVYDSTTTSGFAFGSDAVPTFGTNPVGELRMRNNWVRSNQVIGTTFAELQLLSSLRYRFNLGVNLEGFTQQNFIRQGQLRFRDPLLPARLTRTQNEQTSLLFDNLLTFDQSYGAGAHRLNAVAGYTEQRQSLDQLVAYREGFTDQDLQVIDAGQRSNLSNGATQITLANPNIRWQSNRETNIGVDLGLLNDRLSVTADYYVSTSSGLLVAAPIPWSLGVVGVPVVNAGTIRNTGFELAATHRFERGDFQLNTSLTLMTTRNRVVALGNGGQPIFAGPFGVARTADGLPIGTFWVLKTDGIFQ